MTVWLVRHAPVVMAGFCYGQIDVATTMDADTAADAVERACLALVSAPCDVVVTSPWERTRGIADRLAARWRVPLQVEPRLSELAFGEWEGRRYSEIKHTDRQRFKRWMRDYEHVAPPGGESATALVDRVKAWLDEVTPLPAVVFAVTHAGPIRAARAVRAGVSYAEQALVPVPFLKPERFESRPPR